MNESTFHCPRYPQEVYVFSFEHRREQMFYVLLWVQYYENVPSKETPQKSITSRLLSVEHMVITQCNARDTLPYLWIQTLLWVRTSFWIHQRVLLPCWSWALPSEETVASVPMMIPFLHDRLCSVAGAIQYILLNGRWGRPLVLVRLYLWWCGGPLDTFCIVLSLIVVCME